MVPLSKAYYVYVYSLSSDSWKFFKFAKNSGHADKFDIHLMARFVNGVAYFLTKDEGSRQKIVSFDLTCYIIRQIDMPNGLLYRYGFRVEEYQQSLAILQNTYDNVDIWVLRVSNDSILWDKQAVFELTMGNEYEFRAVGFMNKDKLVLKRSKRRSSMSPKYFIYNVCREWPFTTIYNSGESG